MYTQPISYKQTINNHTTLLRTQCTHSLSATNKPQTFTLLYLGHNVHTAYQLQTNNKRTHYFTWDTMYTQPISYKQTINIHTSLLGTQCTHSLSATNKQ